MPEMSNRDAASEIGDVMVVRAEAGHANGGVETSSGNGRSVGEGGWSVSGWAALGVVLIYAGLFAAGLVHSGGMILLIVAHCMFYLVVYVGSVVAVVMWLAAMGCRVFVFKKRKGWIWAGLKYAIVCFGVVGLGFGAFGLRVPGYVAMTQGFRIHTKVWADVEAIRDWAGSYEPGPGDSPTLHGGGLDIARSNWPGCVRLLGPNYVGLRYEDRSVDLVYGSGFGHWGLYVGPKGAKACGGYTAAVEDGAWVWHEPE